MTIGQASKTTNERLNPLEAFHRQAIRNTELRRMLNDPDYIPQAGFTIREVSEAVTIAILDQVVLCDPSGGAFTVTLPSAGDDSGRAIQIKHNADTANRITVDPDGAETIDGEATVFLISFEMLEIVSDGTNWVIS